MRQTSPRSMLCATLCVWLAIVGCKSPKVIADDNAFEQILEEDDADVSGAAASDSGPDVPGKDAKAAGKDVKQPLELGADVGADLGADAEADDTGLDDTAEEDGAADADSDVANDVDPAADSTPSPQSLLFIGNSYTYVNDLPGMTVTVAKNAGLAWTQKSETVGGATLQAHIDQYGALPLIAKGGQTWVVLQGQSVEPAASQAYFLSAAKTLGGAVTAAQAIPAFYQTWPRKVGDVLYKDAWTGGSPAALFALLQEAYATATTQSGGVRVPAGDAWMDLLAKHPEVELYQPDGSHPSTAGTYLTACVFVGKLGGVDPTAITWAPAGVSATQAQWLRESAKAVLQP